MSRWPRESRAEEELWRAERDAEEARRAEEEELREEFDRLAHRLDPEPPDELPSPEELGWEPGEYERIDDPYDGMSTQEALRERERDHRSDREPGY